ncbi:glutathione-dependent formaldehyde dehydrogenase [Streptomyces longispororuber]|uniref:Glutathione-dependent formaldehyde dehydrogenase n=1 Tax=Streptomyces longispororuber TaxID=68230 RepID=A0A919DIS8_9ACTN|nr:alcohol dehydrogenase catalytic domain-containing protein [Streptomyces longispororuber]GHE45811.1 glutathione-dependent formaldehyde dehydrogenase [Streptomyces longispororuber]
MKAVVRHGVGDIRVEDVPEPKVQDPHDAVVRITTAAISGTDLHLVRGTLPGPRAGQVLGHEAVGVVEETGSGVRNFRPGDRVVISPTVACGTCPTCRAGLYAQCDDADPAGSRGGTVLLGGPGGAGGLDGLQAEYARVPFAHTGLVALPDSVDDGRAVLLADALPAAWFGARLAGVSGGDTVAILGAGPVGLCAVAAARHHGAGRVVVVDGLTDRLALARAQHAETVDFNSEDPVEKVREMTGGAGVDRVIEAVGVDAERPVLGPAADAVAAAGERAGHEEAYTAARDRAASVRSPDARGTWTPGDAPGLAVRWAVEMAARAGSVGILGTYPPHADRFPLGRAVRKNLTLRMGTCHHRRYLPRLVDLVASGALDPPPVLSHWAVTDDAVAAYGNLDRREPGWTKVALDIADPAPPRAPDPLWGVPED